jgi:PKD repeat protein
LANAEWTSIKIDNNRLSIDTIWGTSDNDIYAISFAGKVFHKNDSGWTDISASLFSDASATLLYLPYGIWGTASNNVYVVGSLINYTNGEDSLIKGTPFIFRFNGSEWTRISLTSNQAYLLEGANPEAGNPDTRTGKYYPNWLAGIWGTSANEIYFSGGKFTGVENSNGDPVSGGIVLKYNGSSNEWTGEVGVGDLLNDDYTSASTNPMPMVNEIIGMNGHIYAVGLKGLILHKDNASPWEIMPTESLALNFFRIWGQTPDDLFAVGFNSSNAAAVIYRYNGSAWASMTLPTLKNGYIAALWGIWGEDSHHVHCVGNAGASLYYDGNPGNIWKIMMSDTTTSLNSAWGTSFNSAYAGGEDGKIYHFTEGIKTNGMGAYPKVSVAPQMVEFTDISAGEVDKWEWDFGEGTLSAVAPTADLDYKIFVTAIKDTSMNGARIVVNDNGPAVTGESLETVEAISAKADLGDNPNTSNVSEGVLLITAKPGLKANSYSIHVEKMDESIPDEPARIYHYQYGIYLKVARNTTLGKMADLLESMTDLDLIESAVPDNPNSKWFDINPASSSAKFKGGQNYTINVKIDSGVTTQSEIADLLETHEKIDSAVADTPSQKWVRGAETVSNKATFSGGLSNSNVYVNTDTTLENYYMATHTYKTPGDYTASLTIHRPSVPATAEILVKQSEGPESLKYDQAMAMATIPGTSMNGVTVSIVDGGVNCTPGITWNDHSITITLASGVTTQAMAANLLMKHPKILGAVPSKSDDPWYSNRTNRIDSAKFFNGLTTSSEIAQIAIKILRENPLDFTATPSEGKKNVTAVFKETAGDEIKNRIVKWIWYFNYINTPTYSGPADDESSLALYSADDPATFTYSRIGTYNVKLFVLLDDNSPFSLYKEQVITVKSSDEGKSSFEGGSGLDSVSGCFIDTLDG